MTNHNRAPLDAALYVFLGVCVFFALPWLGLPLIALGFGMWGWMILAPFFSPDD